LEKKIKFFFTRVFSFVKNNPILTLKILGILIGLSVLHYGFLRFNKEVYSLYGRWTTYFVILAIMIFFSFFSILFYDYKKKSKIVIKTEEFRKGRKYNWMVCLILSTSSPFLFIVYLRGLRRLEELYYIIKGFVVSISFILSNIVTSFGSLALVEGSKIKPNLVILILVVLTILGYWMKKYLFKSNKSVPN
jgi:hypothetical protein